MRVIDYGVECFFFFNDTATTEIYTLSLHDALPICTPDSWRRAAASAIRSSRAAKDNRWATPLRIATTAAALSPARACCRSEEHTSELQSRQYLVCRLLLEKKKNSSKIL